MGGDKGEDISKSPREAKRDLSNLTGVDTADSRGPLKNDDRPVDDDDMQIQLIDQMLVQTT